MPGDPCWAADGEANANMAAAQIKLRSLVARIGGRPVGGLSDDRNVRICMVSAEAVSRHRRAGSIGGSRHADPIDFRV